MTREALKSAFREVSRDVSDVDDECFQVIGSDFPLMTLVRSTPFFLELNTVIQMDGQGFNPGSAKRFFPFLNALNQNANLAKLTTDGAEDGTWTVHAKAMIVSGTEGTEYGAEALSNLLTLWHQDIAGIIATEGSYKITGMLSE